MGTIGRRDLLSVRQKQMILVDHNEKSQAVDNIEETEILEIIDHHRLGLLETIHPVYFRNQPVGCTATIMYQIYQEKGWIFPDRSQDCSVLPLFLIRFCSVHPPVPAMTGRRRRRFLLLPR